MGDRSNHASLRGWALCWALLSGVGGCTCGEVTRGILGDQCELNSECDAPLVCRLGRCRKECATNADCDARTSCVKDAEGFGACQLADERMCDLDSECPEPLVCRGDSDARQCVNECETDRDCIAGARCLEYAEGKGCIDLVSRFCVHDGECAASEFCLGGQCREQCRTMRDCGGRWLCNEVPRGDGVLVGVCCPPEDPMCGSAAIDAGAGDAGGGADAGPGADGGEGADAGPALCGGAPLTGVVDMTVGGSHACVIRGSGATTEVLCWGSFGNIGDPGGVTSSPCPVPVPALAGMDIVDIEAGGVHTCAVLATGEVWCWGGNNSGELGRGTMTPDGPPAIVPGVTADGVTADWANTCTWRAGAAAMCWGTNLWCTLGIGARACSTPLIGEPNRLSPVTVTVVAQPQSLALAGGGHVCGIVAGAVECWGKSDYGQLAMGGGTMITDAIDVAAGENYSCAVRATDGSVHCVGENSYGTLGDGTTTARTTLAPVAGLPAPAFEVDANNHTCATLDTGAVYCWGNAMGGRVRPGLDAMAEPTPQMVIASGALKVEVGALFNCALVGDEMRCWGANHAGQLGNGTMTAVDAIVTVLAP